MCMVAAYFISDRPIIGPGSVGMLIRSFPRGDKEKEAHHRVQNSALEGEGG